MCHRAWLHSAFDARAEDLHCRLSRQSIGSDWIGRLLTHDMRLHKGWLDERHINSERSHLIAQGLT